MQVVLQVVVYILAIIGVAAVIIGAFVIYSIMTDPAKDPGEMTAEEFEIYHDKVRRGEG